MPVFLKHPQHTVSST